MISVGRADWQHKEAAVALQAKGAPEDGALAHIYFQGIPPPVPVCRKPLAHRAPSRAARKPGQLVEHSPSWPGAAIQEPHDPFIEWLLRKARLDPAIYRAEALHRRLPACLRALRVPSSEAARALLDKEPGLLSKAVSALLIGVTEFFRDPHVFKHLRQTALPEIAQRYRIRVLSLGCSTGQELYSLAMLLDDLGVLHRSVLVGVDCRADALEIARTGVFPPAEIRVATEGWMNQRLLRSSQGLAVSAWLKRHIKWHQADISGFHWEHEWDLVCFRNISIYLETCRAQEIWERLARLIGPGGLLVTGKAERPPALLPFKQVFPCIFRRMESLS